MLTNDQIAGQLEAIAKNLRVAESTKRNSLTQYPNPRAETWAEEDDVLHCSFCGKGQRQIRKLIAGPGVYICDECVTLCAQILLDHWGMGLHLPFACACEEADNHAFIISKAAAPASETAQAAER